ncbi:ankyrin repeat-containing domain protein [Ustulina deusta]|nr:ankyrin repeat-containing domain protein [Ustulina deusta]
MASTKLYDKALTKFHEGAMQQWSDPKIQTLLEEFVNERSNPQEAQNAAKELQGGADEKYGTDHAGIPASWVSNIIGNIGRIIEFGEFAAGGAAGPEGLVWTAVKIILGAVQSNYNLYVLFGAGLTDVCDVMLLVTHYDRLNDEGAKLVWKPSEMVLKLLDTIVKTYVAVFNFSFSIKRHLTGGLKARLRHAIKDCFGIERSKFQGQLDAIAALKKQILQTSEATFQDTTLRQFQKIHGAIETTVKGIRGFETQLDDIAKAQKTQTDALLRGIKELKSMTTERSPWGKALRTFEKYTNDLEPLKQTAEPLAAALEKKFEGTCEWLFADPVYNAWEKSTGNHMLCLCGQEGSGKSVVLATASDRLALQYARSDTVVLYVSCETIAFNPSGEKKKGSKIVTNTILHQLYSLAVDESKNTELLEACNQTFENRKKGMQGSTPVGVVKSLPDFYDAFPELAKKLKKHAIIAVDAVNLLQDSDQETLFDDLCKAFNYETQLQCRVLVGCRSSTRFYSKVLDASECCTYIDVSDDNNRADQNLVLSSALRLIPGLTQNEQEQAKKEIMFRAGRRFNYITDIAIPFIREPFERPLSNRLDILPQGMADTYSEALRKMSQNYISLLRKALLWTLLSPCPPTIEEIMDDYRGTYNQASPEGNHTDIYSQDNSDFPTASLLEKEQFRIASGPFLQLDSSGYVKLQDPDPIREFCFNSKASNKPSSDQTILCPHCKSNVAGMKTTPKDHPLSITEKDGHLELALTSLRHLNHPLFQRRAGFLGEKDIEDGKEDDNDKAEPKQGNGETTEIDDQTAKVDEPHETAESLIENELKTPGEDDGGPKDGYESERSEDDAQISFPQVYDGETNDAGDQDSSDSIRHIRHEYDYWNYHLRCAEALWPLEERAGNATWDAVMDELDRFVYTNRGAFNHWQSVIFQPEQPAGPLHIASSAGNLCWVKQLLDRNEKPDELFSGFNALQRVALSDHRNIDILKLLLESCGPDCDINTATKSMLPPFHIWIQLDPSIDSVRELLELGGDPTRVSQYNWNSLHYFAYSGSEPEAFDQLFQRAGNEAEKCINLADGNGITPLHVLLYFRRQPPLSILKAFVDKGANVNAEDVYSVRPLQCASLWGMVDSLRILEPKVVDINDPDDEGETALHQAARGGYRESIRFLAEKHADINRKNHHDRTPLHYAAAGCFLDSVKLLLDWPGIYVNPYDKTKRTPLFLACSGNSPETACLILDRLIESRLPVAEINQPSSRSRTPLGQSCASGFVEFVTRLVQYAKERDEVNSLLVNQADAKSGLTPLHHAASRGSVDCVNELLALNADVSTKDKKGRTPLRIAYEYWKRRSKDSGYEETISILINKDKEGAVSDEDLVAVCAAHGSIRLLQQLHGLNADLSKADRYGWSPLDLARKYEHSAVERYLKRQAAWAGQLPSRWVSDDAKVEILGNGLQVSYTGNARTYVPDGAFSISAEKPIPAGLDVYYFEVAVKKLEGLKDYPDVAIGLCTLDGAAISYPGWSIPNAPSALSWGYHSDDGSLRHSGNADSQNKMNAAWRWRAGDTVGIGVNYNKHEIWFTRNGKKIDHVFTDVRGRLFPVLGLIDTVELDTKFAGEFAYRDEEVKEDHEEKTEVLEST